MVPYVLAGSLPSQLRLVMPYVPAGSLPSQFRLVTPYVPEGSLPPQLRLVVPYVADLTEALPPRGNPVVPYDLLTDRPMTARHRGRFGVPFPLCRHPLAGKRQPPTAVVYRHRFSLRFGLAFALLFVLFGLMSRALVL